MRLLPCRTNLVAQPLVGDLSTSDCAHSELLYWDNITPSPWTLARVTSRWATEMSRGRIPVKRVKAQNSALPATVRRKLPGARWRMKLITDMAAVEQSRHPRFLLVEPIFVIYPRVYSAFQASVTTLIVPRTDRTGPGPETRPTELGPYDKLANCL